MALQTYNGFPGGQRADVAKIHRKMKKEGYKAPTNKCCIVGLEFPEKQLQRHQEDYDKVYEVHVISIEAHMLLHTRFFKKNAWINFLYNAHLGKIDKFYSSPYHYFQNSKKYDEKKNENAIEHWMRMREKKDHSLRMYNLELEKVDRKKLSQEQKSLYNGYTTSLSLDKKNDGLF